MPSTLGATKQVAEKGEPPLITIGVTTYDRPQMLRQCVASILSQSYSNIEVIIGNDFVDQPVTFDSLGIKEDPRVRIVNHPQNIGAYNNNYFLLREASGDWFTWLADDDLMHREFLKVAYDTFSTHNVNSVFTNYLAASDPDGVFPRAIRVVAPQIFSGSEFINEYSSRRIKTVGSYGIFRRELCQKLGSVKRFGSGLPVYGDTFMPILAASFGSVAYVDLDLIFLRTHKDSRSANSDCIETFSSAQKDFLTEFERCCGKLMEPSDYQRQLVNMLDWFATDGWAVICRRQHGVYKRIINFYWYSKNDLMPYFPASFKGNFRLFVVKLVVSDSLRSLASRVLRKVRFWV